MKSHTAAISKTEMTLPKIEMTQTNFNKLDSIEISPIKAGTAGTTIARAESNINPWTNEQKALLATTV
jgi:hypothetical protein